MRFENPNIYFCVDNGEFFIRWTLVAFFVLVTSFVIYIILIKAFSDKTKNKTKLLSIQIIPSKMLFLSLLYASTLITYFFRNVLSDNGTSLIYKSSEQLNTHESIVVAILVVMFLMGLKFKNSDTYFDFYARALAVLEIIYIIACYITNQVDLCLWYNWLCVFVLGVLFVALSTVKFAFKATNNPNDNIHDPIIYFQYLFENRKRQAEEIISIIKSSISDSGYSVCIAGEWGSGKTSLINGVIDKLNKSNDTANVHIIRINAMELDDLKSLTYYFFEKIEEILKLNNIYVGVASEYRELIGSITGTIVSESAGDFIVNKFKATNTDYRENLEKLNNIISLHLAKSKIAIIVDDTERCSPEKIKQFLFFMKEIATMNRCITLFLVDTVKLKSVCNLDDSFYEKFFNHTINIAKADTVKVLDSVAKYQDESQEIRDIVNGIFVKYDSEIEKAESERYLYIPDPSERERHRNERTNAITKCKDRFASDLSNPRRLLKSVEYFEMLNRLVKQQETECPVGRLDIFHSFLRKVDYRRQLALLSLLYGLYQYEFQIIQIDGIYDYMSNLGLRLSDEQSPNEEMFVVDFLVKDEWCGLLHSFSDYKYQEALRFINCVLTKPDELVNISNGYSSLEEKYIARINQGFLPEELSFPETVEMIYHATSGKYAVRYELIKRALDLFEKTLSNKEVDLAFELFSERGVCNMVSIETPILQLFADIFCINSFKIVNPKKAKGIFIKFADSYLWHNLQYMTAYFYPLPSPNEVSWENWRNAVESVLTQSNCDQMISSFCKKAEEYLVYNNSNADDSALLHLNKVMDYATNKYNDLKMSEYDDVQFTYDNARKLLCEIKNLFRIESFINSSIETMSKETFNIKEISIETLSQAIKNYYEITINNETAQREYIERLLRFICTVECAISLDDYKMLNDIALHWYRNNGSPIGAWRQMLVFIYTNRLVSMEIGDEPLSPI